MGLLEFLHPKDLRFLLEHTRTRVFQPLDCTTSRVLTAKKEVSHQNNTLKYQNLAKHYVYNVCMYERMYVCLTDRRNIVIYITNRRQLVQRCPAVPTDANNTDGTTNDKSASSITIIALFPLSSSRHLPNLSLTILCTIWPTWKTKIGRPI